MKQNKPGKLREMTDQELLDEEAALTDQMFKIRFQAAAGQQDDPVGARIVRRNRARVKTVLRERELAAQREKKA